VQIAPLGFELAVAVEHLNPVVPRSATKTQPPGSQQMLWRDIELAGVGAGLPHDISNLPSGVYLWIRALP